MSDLRVCLEQLPFAFAMFDQQMRCLATNKKWLAEYQLDSGMIHQGLRDSCTQCLLSGTEVKKEEPFKKNDGSEGWIRLEVQPWRDKASGLGGITVFVEDITARKKLEQRFKEQAKWNEAKYQVLFETASDSILVVNQNGAIEMVNPQVERLFGYTAQELLGQPIEILVPESHRESHRNHRNKFIQNPHSRPMGAGLNLYARKKDGTLFPVDIALGSGQTEDDERIVTAVVRDITERKQIEEQQRILSRLSSALSVSTDFEGRLVQATEFLAKVYCDWVIIDLIDDNGYIKRTASGNLDKVSKDTLERLKQSKPSSMQMEDVLLCAKDEKSILVPSIDWVETEKKFAGSPDALLLYQDMAVQSYMRVPLMAREHAVGVITFKSTSKHYDEQSLRFAQDIAEKVALSLDNARLYQEARASVKSREEILAIVSHDLKNPLSSISLSTALLAKLNASGSVKPDIIKRHAENVERATRRMLRLISDILDFSKIQTGKFDVRAVQEDLHWMLETVFRQFRPIALSKKVDFILNVEPDLPSVTCDADRIIQVLSNIINNAIKFSHSDGTITLSAKSNDDHVVISLSDTGVGIPANQLSCVFDRFWQAKETATQGTGLGLAISREIVHAHHGKIWAESEVGKGTTFYFTLPAVVRSSPGLTVCAGSLQSNPQVTEQLSLF